jgi:pantoate kinase
VVADFLELVSDTSYTISVKHEITLPIGCGFGVSGAGALSLALALNEGFELGLSRLKAAQIAHIAEVLCKTGLGSVISETYGGIEIRVKPGGPGVGEIQTIPSSKDYVVVSLPFGPLSTAKFLTSEEARRRINELGGELTDALICQPSLSNLLNFSRQFAEHIQLVTTRVRGIIEAAEDVGITCSTAIFGENVFSIVHKDQIQEAEEVFSDHQPEGYELMIMRIDDQGARVIDG